MAKLHQKTVARHAVNGRTIEVDLCWQGDNPEHDEQRFYDIYDSYGNCLNEGNPWHDDGLGAPTVEELTEAFKDYFKGD